MEAVRIKELAVQVTWTPERLAQVSLQCAGMHIDVFLGAVKRASDIQPPCPQCTFDFVCTQTGQCIGAL